MASNSSIQTPLTELLGIKHPIILAGMARASSGALAAAVSNAGGLGVIGGLNYSPQQLQEIINELKAHLTDKTLPFGVDLALPKIGGGARKTNYDYTKGKLDELIDVVIRNGAKLFVSAVGIPPPHIIERLHASKILIMNMVGAPKHAKYALDAGVDLICAQGAEGGGHTGSIATSILIPAVCDVVRDFRSPMTGQVPLVVAAGGIRDGRSLASALMQGAAGVWVGTRFLASVESGASEIHKTEVVTATFEDTVTTLVVSGRPMRVKANEYIKAWERQPAKIKELTEAGIVPYTKDMEDGNEDADRPFLMGQVAAVIDDIKPASQIVEGMVKEASQCIRRGASFLVAGAKL
ncbi:hypothetical protein PV10_05198 [Exophiala mesophila]|uniref:Uncharacterized protein n=1 Tax=Exophiala mesophila TaxID=212818 RepID=A0A0D1WXD7_EXOME|nr:uncharacterized protein PV10_05198 [Exophiala mesophila]KIV94040.1 hypothetical protein PV10_05198 [Exophiala mesophila]